MGPVGQAKRRGENANGRANGKAPPEPVVGRAYWQERNGKDPIPVSTRAADRWRVADPYREKSFDAPGFLDSILSAGLGPQSEIITRPYHESGWVHAALKVFGAAVRSVPLQFFTSNPDENKDATAIGDAHPLVRLFDDPSPDFTPSQFFEAGLLHRKLSGEDFWIFRDATRSVIRAGSSDRIQFPTEIEPVPGFFVDHEIDSEGFVRAWRFREPNGKTRALSPASVVQFRDYDPHNRRRGIGDVAVLMRALQQEFSAEHYTEGLLRNGGDPGGWVKVKHQLTPDSARETQADIDDKQKPANRGRWRMMHGEEIEIIPNKVSPKDMEFQALFDRVRDLVSSVIGVPLPVMGVLDRATWSNYAQANFTFWTGGNGVIPYLMTVEDVIQRRLLPRIGYRGIFARFDLSGIDALTLQHNDLRESAVLLMEKVPGMTWNRAAMIVGLDIDPTPEGDIALVPNTLVPFQAAADGETLQSSGGDDDDGGDDEELVETEPAPSREEEERALRYETRSLYWRNFRTDVLDLGERKLKRTARAFLRRYVRAQIDRVRRYAEGGPNAVKSRGPRKVKVQGSALTEADINVLLVVQADWEEAMGRAFETPLQQIFGSASKDLAAQLGTSFIPTADPEAVRFLLGQRIQLTEGVTSTLANRVRKIILGTFAEVDTIASLQELIRAELPALEGNLRLAFRDNDARALTIARTETAHAANGARHMQMRRDGVRRHEWITSRDAAVRHSHQELDTQVRKVGEAFKPGLRYPSDEEGSAAEVINCRCVTVPVDEDEQFDTEGFDHDEAKRDRRPRS